MSERLTTVAQTYHRDSTRLAAMSADDSAALAESTGMTGQQWAAVYKAVADELHKVADQ